MTALQRFPTLAARARTYAMWLQAVVGRAAQQSLSRLTVTAETQATECASFLQLQIGSARAKRT